MSTTTDRFGTWAIVGLPGHRRVVGRVSEQEIAGAGFLRIDVPAPGGSDTDWSQTQPDGMLVCHRCDNPPCCNPEHLYPGAPLVNTQDKMAKGRAGTKRGEALPQARLTSEDVVNIRQRYASGGMSQRALAREFGVSRSAVCDILRRRRWRHV